MAVKITTLVENSPGANPVLKNEHGLSFFIEKDDQRILFDTGQSSAFLHNAEQLQVDLSNLDYVVLSHGHYDHSGGLKSLVKSTTDFKLIIGEGFFGEKYGKKDNALEYLGNDFDQEFLHAHNIGYQFAAKRLTELAPGIYVVTGFPKIHQDEVLNEHFLLKREDGLYPDSFDDEILLAIDTSKGLLVLLGCSHPGMKNMLDSTVRLLNRSLYGVLGGTHLMQVSEKNLDLSVKYLQKESLKVIGVCHCTGQVAMDSVRTLDDRFFHNRTGSTLLVE